MRKSHDGWRTDTLAARVSIADMLSNCTALPCADQSLNQAMIVDDDDFLAIVKYMSNITCRRHLMSNKYIQYTISTPISKYYYCLI
jgi:hypothetical protein